MTRLFSYVNAQNQPMVGVEWQDKTYNFTQAWELYKQIKLGSKAPSFPFLQLVVEMDLFHKETFDELFATLQEYRPLTDLLLRGRQKLQPPIGRPQKIIGIGRNYGKHARELGNEVPEEVVFFAKAPSSLIATGEDIHLPANVGRVDHEGELALVIGKTAKNVSAGEAMDYLAGYSLVNDVTAREIQNLDKNKGLPWFRAKSYDSFCPFGPYLVPAAEIADPHNLTLTVSVNGKIRQNGHTGDMIFSIAELIAYVSRHLTLMPGDIIATGTPDGVSPLLAGDIVEVEIQGLGKLTNRVV